MWLAQEPQRSGTSEAGTRSLSVSSQALFHWATTLPGRLNTPNGVSKLKNLKMEGKK